MQGFGAKTLAVFLFKNLCRDYVQNTVQGFSVHLMKTIKKSCAEFWRNQLRSLLMKNVLQGFGARKLGRVLEQKSAQGFGAKLCARFWCKELQSVLV